jgi:carboxyl-terminal processing protease
MLELGNYNDMTSRFAVRFLLVALGCRLVLGLSAAEPAAAPLEDSALENSPTYSTNAVHINAGPADGRIAFVTARMLEQFHYSRRPMDLGISTQFFDRYLETLDPQHVHFTQGDLEDFAFYRTNLNAMTVGPSTRGFADTTAAFNIFNRFMERLQQHVAYVDELLKNDKFNFDTDERIVINRHELPYPKDLNEAKQIWRGRLRFEYLQEKLGKIEARKKAAAAPKSEVKPVDTAASAKPKTEAEEIVETLEHTYHYSVRNFQQWDNQDVLQVYLSALSRVYDPHTDYMGPAPLDNFAIGMNLSLSGIGAELMQEEGYCTIHRLLPGGPAIKSKLINENDRILAVAQSNRPPVNVVDMNLTKAVQMIRGPKGTEVRLTVVAKGSPRSASRVVVLVRDEVKLEDQAAKAKIIELPNTRGENLRVGVIDLPSFYAPFDPTSVRGKTDTNTTTADVALLLTKLKQENVSGVILDLRRNGGGSLEEAIKLTGLFIDQGPVVQVKDFEGNVQQEDDPNRGVFYDGPLIVLTSRFSASASEILAGALQDYGRALVVGDSSTHGKGTVQMVNPLRQFVVSRTLTNDPGALKITIKKFYRPSGASTQKKGVVPDIVLPSLANEHKDWGESALENSLAYDTIPSAKYEHLNLVTPYLPELAKRSAQRIGKDAEYAYIREDIDLYRKQLADKTVSLNEKQQLKERDEAEARQKAREKERKARKEPAEKVYELTLKQASLPGLPPPVAKTNSAIAKLSMPKAGGLVVGTNATVATATAVPKLDNSAEEEKAPPTDAALDEAEHILVDYLYLLPKGNLVTVGHSPS